jgi:hypothetical protein
VSVTRTLLDSAALADLSYVLDQRRLPRQYEWSYQCAFETTCLLISTDSVRIAPPMARRTPQGVNAELRTALSSFIQRYKVNSSVKEVALKATSEWFSEPQNQAVVREFIGGSALDFAGESIGGLVGKFMENERRYWPETVVELGGVYDKGFLVQISQIIERPESELLRLHHLVEQRPSVLSDSASELTGDRLDIAERSFLASVLIRGYFRDTYARRGQVLHHPFRSIFLAKCSNGAAEGLFEPSNSLRAVASILIEASMLQKTGRSRIDYYANSLRILRGAARQGRLNLGQVDTDSEALADAADTMIKLGIRTRSPSTDRWIDALIGGGITLSTAFTLTPWESLVSGLTTSTLSGLVGVGDTVGKALLERRYRLSHLGRSGWGRLQRPRA